MDFSAFEFSESIGGLGRIPMILLAVLGMICGFLLSAACLRKAADWLSFESLTFWHSLRLVLLVNGVLLMLNLVIGLNFGLAAGLFSSENTGEMTRSMWFSFSPTFFLWQMLFGLVISSSILCRLVAPRVPEGRDRRHASFVEGLGLASVYFGLWFGMVFLVAGMAAGLMAFVMRAF